MKTLTLKFTPSTIAIVILSLVIVSMLALWQPWNGSKVERTITTTGQGEVKGVPDEFIFSPYFQRTGSDSAKLKDELGVFGAKLQTELIKLGVDKDDITLSANSYEKPSIEPYAPDSKPTTSSDEDTVTLSVSIKVPSEKLAQKVQDYLATTDADGQLTAYPNFSKQKREQLEDQARDKATKNAREKAERSAKNLGGSIGKVVTVKDSGGSSVYPTMSIAEDSGSRSSLPVTPGQDEVSISVEVVFELR